MNRPMIYRAVTKLLHWTDEVVYFGVGSNDSRNHWKIIICDCT